MLCFYQPNRLTSVFSFVAAAILCAGCGQSGPALNSVSGKLTIGGEPAKNIQISFYPSPANPTQPIASAQVDASGNFVLFSGGSDRKGAVTGKFKIVLAQMAGTTTQDAAAQYQSGGGKAPGVTKASFPEEFLSAETSTKEVEVKSGPNIINLDF